VVALCAGALALYLVAVWNLDPVVRWLWPIPVGLFVVYPYLKRFTWLGHLWLGASLGLAPVGAWVAVTGELPWEAWTLGAAVAFWVAGFDLFYGLLDYEHDRQVGLHSWATRFGERGVFAGSAVMHATTLVLLAATGVGLGLGLAYCLGLGIVGLLLGFEHSLIGPGDHRRLDAAFFTVNGVISIVFLVAVVIETTT
jgi:4-hydroxybenzoate polyprenyltransferase